MAKKVEYRVQKVTRYIVTEWHQEDLGNGSHSGGSQCYGEFDWERGAYITANALGCDTKSKNPEWEVKYPEVPIQQSITSITNL